jgi:sodium-dependent dicarboxylate transporter 2/3/5
MLTLIDHEIFRRIPWGIILLFGGGFALAKGFVVSGLSDYIAEAVLADIGGLPILLMILIICLTMTFLTEFTLNTASTQLVLPILAAAAIAQELHPLVLMVPATFSASMAFMMPVATPPNAIVFGSERVGIREMCRAGLVLNLIGVILVTLAMVFIAQPVLGF